MKQHVSLIINLFPRVWRLFVIFVCSWIFDQDTKSQKFGLFLGLVFLLGIGHIHIWSRSDNGTAPVVSGLGVQCGVWFCIFEDLCINPFGLSFDTTTPIFTLTFQGHLMMSHTQKSGRILWFYCGRNQFILVVVL